MYDLTKKLESIYLAYNRREFVDPDPLLFLYDYPHVEDREVVGLIGSCLAYGRVEMIMKTLRSIFEIMKSSPRKYLINSNIDKIVNDFKGFKYRFTKEEHIITLLTGIKQVLKKYDSLSACFMTGMTKNSSEDIMTLPGLVHLITCLDPLKKTGNLLADPMKNSPCKRIHLFLRWMIRKDMVDPGGWNGISPSQLIIPLDTHMFKIGVLFRFTQRKRPDRKTALEITRGFRQINTLDPVKYDFCLTRFGIQRNLNIEMLQQELL